MLTCCLCCDDYPADLIVGGTCYLCREALSCHAARVLEPPDAESAWELAEHYDATRVDLSEYAPGDHTPIEEVDVYAYETATEARGEL